VLVRLPVPGELVVRARSLEAAWTRDRSAPAEDLSAVSGGRLCPAGRCHRCSRRLAKWGSPRIAESNEYEIPVARAEVPGADAEEAALAAVPTPGSARSCSGMRLKSLWHSE
jgi:hypothetical protein